VAHGVQGFAQRLEQPDRLVVAQEAFNCLSI
jgi:hypothetical protein